MLKSRAFLSQIRELHRLHHLPLSTRRSLLTLAIETSCDDTSVAILEKNGANGSCDAERPSATLHFHERVTADNTKNKGIDPIRALSSHASNLALLVEESLQSLPTVSAVSAIAEASPGSASISESAQNNHVSLENGTRKATPDFISVTRGPGIRSSLSCGLDTAKGLCVAWQIPLLAVHHMQAHALTPRLAHALSSGSGSGRAEPSFPFLSLLVSGGHTLLLHSKSLVSHETLAGSSDIAIGEALDKMGRLILPTAVQASLTDVAYAKHLSTYAFPTAASFIKWYQPPPTRGAECHRSDNEYGWDLPVPFTNSRELRFSFSGIASEAHRLFTLRCGDADFTEAERIAFARAALTTAFNHLASRTVIAVEGLRRRGQTIDTLVVSGGVAANPFLRHVLRCFLDVRGFGHVRLAFPPVHLCTDNAAMIGWLGVEMWDAGWRSERAVEALKRWGMDHPERDAVNRGNRVGDGGILSVGGWYNVHGL